MKMHFNDGISRIAIVGGEGSTWETSVCQKLLRERYAPKKFAAGAGQPPTKEVVTSRDWLSNFTIAPGSEMSIRIIYLNRTNCVIFPFWLPPR
jgi:hypothetical protein